jgi:cobalt/nickel transport system permease protein
MYGISGIMLYISVKMINKKFDDKMVPYMGVLAAVIFAAQLVNFPVPPSSGHLVGSTLLAVMLGPWAGMLIIGMVLFVQALMGDGGLLTFGVNFFNMGVFSSFVGWALALILFKGLKRVTDEKKSVLVSASVASFFVTVLAAIVLGLELLTVTGFGVAALSAITVVHVFIGIGEAVLTFVILLYFVKAKPQVISFLKESEVSEMARVPMAPSPTQQIES